MTKSQFPAAELRYYALAATAGQPDAPITEQCAWASAMDNANLSVRLGEVEEGTQEWFELATSSYASVLEELEAEAMNIMTTKSEVIDQVVYPLARQAGWLVAVDTDTLNEALSDIFDALEEAGLIQTVWGEGWTVSDDPEQAAAISEVIIDTLMATEVRAAFRMVGATLRADGDRWAITPDERHRWDAEGIPPKATLRAVSLDEALDLLPVLVELHDEPGVAGAAYLGIEA